MNKLILALLLVLCALPVRAADVSGAFGQGSAQFSLLAGSGYAFNSDYFIIGAGVNYFVHDGLSVGLTYENWSGAGPTINKTSPSVQYVFNLAGQLKPYVGAFYRHATISDYPSINSVGGRAGAYITSNSGMLIGFGLAYESYLNCQTVVFSSCSETYPELSILFSF